MPEHTYASLPDYEKFFFEGEESRELVSIPPDIQSQFIRALGSKLLFIDIEDHFWRVSIWHQQSIMVSDKTFFPVFIVQLPDGAFLSDYGVFVKERHQIDVFALAEEVWVWFFGLIHHAFGRNG